MERWRGRTALVTGASSGIGYSLAETLVKAGVNVIGCARNISRIEELRDSLKVSNAPGSVDAMSCDISKEEDVLRMFAEIANSGRHVDILVNNAGMAKPDTLLAGETEKWREMLELNILGLSMCAREGVKSMASNNVTDGHIININSMLGHFMPNRDTSHFYSATKHMVTALSEALYKEVKTLSGGKHIRVTNLSPGVVATEFHVRMRVAAPKTNEGFKPLDAQDVADAAVFVLSTPPHVCIKEMIIAPTDTPGAGF